MLVQEAVEADLQIELLLCHAAMANDEILVDKFDGKDGLGAVEWSSLFDANHSKLIWTLELVKGNANQPCICTLPDCFGDDTKGKLAGQWGKLRMSYHVCYCPNLDIL